MIELTSKQRKELEKVAHDLQPVVIVGGAGVTDGVMDMIDKSLAAHELIKVKFNEYKDEKQELTQQICEKTDATLVRIIGNIAILFREKEEKDDQNQDKSEENENLILKDNNHAEIKNQTFYEKDKSPFTPTNRIITSLCNPERLLFLLQYGIAYVERTDKNGITHLEKHIMRYPQMFATKAIHNRIESDRQNNIPQTKGIIWHTQGSGKTALAYFVSQFLRDYYAGLAKPVRFFFIVDRLDLMTQAKK